MYLCNATIIKLSRRSLLVDDRKRDFMICSCSFSATIAEWSRCKPRMLNKYVEFGNGNGLQRVWESRLIPLPEIKRFQICKERFSPIGKTQIVNREVVGSNHIHGRWAEVFHIELWPKIRFSVLRWLTVVSDCTGTPVKKERVADVLDTILRTSHFHHA